jgi:hypothetical protein
MVHPIVTALGFAALYSQPLDAATNPDALSVLGLGVQAVVFLGVGLSWVFRITIPFGGLMEWYQWVGWAAVDNIIFALV